MKTCSRCGEEKQLDEFYPDKKSRDGKRGFCKACHRARANVAYFRNHEENKAERRRLSQERNARTYSVLIKLKSVPCADCGGRFPPICMDFDHVSGEKVMGVAEMVSARKALDLILAEVAKCEVVCANCHRIRTATRAEWDHLRGEAI